MISELTYQEMSTYLIYFWFLKLQAYTAKPQGSTCSKDVDCISGDCVLPLLGLGAGECAKSVNTVIFKNYTKIKL